MQNPVWVNRFVLAFKKKHMRNIVMHNLMTSMTTRRPSQINIQLSIVCLG